MGKIKFLIAKALKKILNPPALRNCKADKTSKVLSKSELTGVKVGRYSYIGNQCFMVNTDVGAFCSIADRCVVGGATHPIERVSTSPVFHTGNNVLQKNFATFEAIKTPRTVIEHDVWMGMGVFVKAGVTIHTGSVVGMGSVVTHDIPPYEIWAGNPAKKIRDRFDDEIKQELLNSKWWEWNEDKLKNESKLFDNTSKFCETYRKGN